MTDQIAQEIDAVGLLCPLPILRFKKRTHGLPAGSLVELVTDDPTGRKDLEALCQITGHQLLDVMPHANGVIRYRVRLG
ncbi:MAG: sulfurtransferase TusA family protein [Litorivicinus sp.]